MLCYSERTWQRFLNPGSNLNRLRVWDYERLFSSRFPSVAVQVRNSDLPAFRATRARIRPEFLTGDENRDDHLHPPPRVTSVIDMAPPLREPR